jgi:crotonobetainyl-CoA:carnitine CoA-transferase CaiB-like acyl-CoA transferase
MNSLPLSGITVVTLEHAVAAPLATRQLADLGARVIKVERPGVGDFARGYDTSVRGMSSYFIWLNRSMESIALDVKSETGGEVLGRLINRADVIVQNLAPGAAERLGLGASTLRSVRPNLICCSISGYGEGGPYGAKKAYDLLIQCESGLVSVTGSPDAPAKVGISVADIATGMYAYSGILAALLRRQNTGEGATIEVSMLEALGEWMGNPMYYALYGGAPPSRTGVAHASIAPYGSYVCGDTQQVFLGVQNEREWAVFCEQVLERPELCSDPRFVNNSRRVQHGEDLDQLITERFARHDRQTVIGRLETAGIANAQLRDMTQFIAHEQLAARGRWREIQSPVGPLRALLPATTIDGIEPQMGPVPGVGEHTQSILEELGFGSVA